MLGVAIAPSNFILSEDDMRPAALAEAVFPLMVPAAMILFAVISASQPSHCPFAKRYH